MELVKTTAGNQTISRDDVTDTTIAAYAAEIDIPTLARSHYFFKASMAVNKNDDVKHNFSTLLARCYVVTSFCNI